MLAESSVPQKAQLDIEISRYRITQAGQAGSGAMCRGQLLPDATKSESLCITIQNDDFTFGAWLRDPLFCCA